MKSRLSPATIFYSVTYNTMSSNNVRKQYCKNYRNNNTNNNNFSRLRIRSDVKNIRMSMLSFTKARGTLYSNNNNNDTHPHKNDNNNCNNNKGPKYSRRTSAIRTLLMATSPLLLCKNDNKNHAWSAEVLTTTTNLTDEKLSSKYNNSSERQHLLDLISTPSIDQDVIFKAIADLIQSSSSNSFAIPTFNNNSKESSPITLSSAIEGKWRLLWRYFYLYYYCDYV